MKGKLCTNKAGITKRVDGKGGWYYVEKGVLQTKKSGLTIGHMVYAPRTVGFGLCPAVAPFLSEGMLTNLPGSGCAVEKSYLGGNCTATANLLLDILRDHGFDCQLQNNMPGTYHVGVRVKFTSGSHKGESFIFDPMFSGVSLSSEHKQSSCVINRFLFFVSTADADYLRPFISATVYKTLDINERTAL